MFFSRQHIFVGCLCVAWGFLLSCQGQKSNIQKLRQTTAELSNQPIGGGCEGCELMYVGMPNTIESKHTSLGWSEGSQKFILTGKVFQLDGKTPAPDVIIYYWHTNNQGLYTPNEQTPAQAKPHGQLRGWVKTDAQGNYTIQTSRPAAYPNDVIPQHIHLSIKEPDLPQEYYADLYFEDDPLYAAHQKKYGQLDRAGSELLRVVADGKIQIATHNFSLGLNIPNYPSRSGKSSR